MKNNTLLLAALGVGAVYLMTRRTNGVVAGYRTGATEPILNVSPGMLPDGGLDLRPDRGTTAVTGPYADDGSLPNVQAL